MALPRLFPLLLVLVFVSTARAEKNCFWNVEEGELAEAANWKPEETPDLSSTLRWEIRNGGTALVSAGQNSGLGLDLLIASSGGSGTLVLNGDGSLTIQRYLSIGQAGTGTGEVKLNDTSSLYIVNGTLLVGQRSNGSLTIAKGASVVVQSGNTKIAEGMNGTVTMAGRLETPDLFFGSKANADSEQNGTLNFEPGAVLKVGRNITIFSTGHHVLHVNGSGGVFSAGSLVTDSSAVFRFTADKNGVTPVQIQGACNVSDASLEIDLDAYTFKGAQEKLMLFQGESLVGEFANVTFLGKTKGKLSYNKKGISVSR